MVESLQNGKIECLDDVANTSQTVLKSRENTHFEFCKKYVDEIVTVSDDEISSAILALIEQHKLISEGAGAVSVAAAMFNKVPIKGKGDMPCIRRKVIDVTILSKVIKKRFSNQVVRRFWLAEFGWVKTDSRMFSRIRRSWRKQAQ